MSSGYMDRALKHPDPRFADLLRKLGHKPESEPVVQSQDDEDDDSDKGGKKEKRKYNRRDMRAKDE